MAKFFEDVACAFRPDVREMEGELKAVCSADIIGVLYLVPLVALSLAWVGLRTDPAVIRQNWLLMAALLALVYLFRRVSFTAVAEIREGTFADYRGSVEGMCVWAAALVLGPTALWLAVPFPLLELLRWVRNSPSENATWSRVRTTMQEMGWQLLPGMVALIVLPAFGGAVPLSSLSAEDALPALAATGVRFLVGTTIQLPFVIVLAYSSALALTRRSRAIFWRFAWMSNIWALLIDPFAVLAAGLLAVAGRWAAGSFMLGALLASGLAHRMSDAIQRSAQQSRVLKRLELLARAILEAPPDGSQLPELLERNAGDMFMYGRLEIRLFPDRRLLSQELRSGRFADEMWRWLEGRTEPEIVRPLDVPPWGGAPTEAAIIVVPVIDVDTGKAIGGVALERRRYRRDAAELVPSLQALAAQVASALHSAANYRNRLEVERYQQELALAEEIQNSLLPEKAPVVPGWGYSASLESAVEASGDFFDIIPLPDDRCGLVIGDVSGKGVSSALYMALVRTLIRTYASEYRFGPDQVLAATNTRMMNETRAELFATLFYGLLDHETGQLTYASAGHNPALILRPDGGSDELESTGIPLGMLSDQLWEVGTTTVPQGGAVVLYTDGLTDAENPSGEDLGFERFVEVARQSLSESAWDLRTGMLERVNAFVDGAEQKDDMTLLVVVRKAA